MLSATLAVGTAMAQQTFNNPIAYYDLPDIDIIRVDDAFYYSASTMHYSPGAPLLISYDLVNWEIIGHSVPSLDFGPNYNLDGGSAYDAGIWASSMGYRKSNGLFYWYGCMSGTDQTQVYTASDPAGPWTRHQPIDKCLYDLGLLIDEDDTMYIAYDRYNISVAQLTEDGLGIVRDEVSLGGTTIRDATNYTNQHAEGLGRPRSLPRRSTLLQD